MQADQVLVDQCRTGDRDAFAQIVQRYQTRVCSIAYGATGSLSASEEPAQEMFVAAWRSIYDLRDAQREATRSRRCCCLYTDLANPTSNASYARLGYRPQCDVVCVTIT